MKLRDFVANSLPRVRGRKKKGQTGNGAPASITAAVAAAAAVATSTGSACSLAASQQTSPDSNLNPPTSPRSASQDRNGNWFSFGESRFGFFEKLVGKDSPVKRLLETKERRGGSSASKSEKRHDEDDERRSSLRFCPSSATEPSSPYSRPGVQSPPLGEKPVFHSQHASPVSVVSWAARDRYSDWDCSSLYTSGYGYPESLTSFDSTPGSQRGPRSRSRIRTNPWLPSPRPSPYSVRSLSSPCTSSRSPSPSSSPIPPSSSDSTSPLTSFSSDVSATREAQLQRHRRHRRHHSEVKASDLTRHMVFDPSLTDTEQYYSTLDSGIGDTALSSGEKDKHKLAASRKQRNQNSKRKSVERDSDLVKHKASSSPKSKPRFRTKNRSSRSSSSAKGLIANRDSKFWDSDSSSRSPPRTSRSLGNSEDLLYFDSFHSEGCVVSRCSKSSRIPREAVLGFLPDDFVYDPHRVDFGPVSGTCPSSSVLSPSDDICIITSNIEQLAQNISSEYEEGLDLSFESMLECSKGEQKEDSLSDLYHLDSDSALTLGKLEPGPCGALDYSSFAGPLQCRDVGTEEEESRESTTSANTPQPDTAPDDDDTSTVDVAVQTDFADDEEEDISGSDWLASTESGSDWVTSNGSGSDCPTSGGSDWPTGEGSGCATEAEEEEEGGERGEEQVEEESTLWVQEGSRLWFVPDIMQNSTDTGYSSLSRDGRIVTDDNNNNHHNNNNNNNNSSNDSNDAGANAEDSSDSSSATTTTTTTTDEKMSKMSDSDMTKSESPSTPSRSDIIASGAIPKTSTRHTLSSTCAALSKDFGESLGDSCAQRISCKLEFNIMGGKCNCPRNRDSFGNEKPLLPSRSCDQSEDCVGDDGFSVNNKNRQAELQRTVHRTSSVQLERRNSYDHVVPYPYDVRRFSDVTLPYDEREGSISPCFHDSLSSRSDDGRQKPAVFTSTPRHHGSEPEDFYSCTSPTRMTSDWRDVTARDITASSAFQGHLESYRSSALAVPIPLLRRSLPLRSCEDLPCSGRPLQEVRASLEDKVQILRQGKRLVSKKIREAREEEMVRQQQKLRFQRLLDIHRKRILLETLQDLRLRLESQSARLQASYSAVLNLQKRCA